MAPPADVAADAAASVANAIVWRASPLQRRQEWASFKDVPFAAGAIAAGAIAEESKPCLC